MCDSDAIRALLDSAMVFATRTDIPDFSERMKSLRARLKMLDERLEIEAGPTVEQMNDLEIEIDRIRLEKRTLQEASTSLMNKWKQAQDALTHERKLRRDTDARLTLLEERLHQMVRSA
jgi:predicted  nucleic acid-binding Zn-ribbon protein